MRTYKDLETETAAAAEDKRCREQFDMLCQRQPTLVPCEANFAVFMQYFEDSLKFDFASAESAITNDPKLVAMLAVRPIEQVEEDRKQAVIDHNEKLRAMPVEELRAQLFDKHREFLVRNTPTPPDTLTRKVYRDASAEQNRQWIKYYTLAVLNEHFDRLDAKERV